MVFLLQLEAENISHLQRLRITERDVEATKTELELINEIVNSIERANDDDGKLCKSASALTLLDRMKSNRNDAVNIVNLIFIIIHMHDTNLRVMRSDYNKSWEGVNDTFLRWMC